MNHGGRASTNPEQIQFIERFEGGNGHPDRGRVQLQDACVRLVPALPDPVVGNAVGGLNAEDEVLNDCDLVEALDDLEARGCHLGQDQQVKADGVYLQVAPFVIANDLIEIINPIKKQ